MPSSMNWVDGAAGGTPVSAANLNKLAVVADVGTAGTPTGDALRAAYVPTADLPFNLRQQGGFGDGRDESALLTTALASGRPVYIPAGTWFFQNVQGPANTTAVIYGDGDATILQSHGNPIFTLNGATGTTDSGSLSQVYLQCDTDMAPGAALVNLKLIRNFTIDRVNGAFPGDHTGTFFLFDTSYQIVVRQCMIRVNRYGLGFEANSVARSTEQQDTYTFDNVNVMGSHGAIFRTTTGNYHTIKLDNYKVVALSPEDAAGYTESTLAAAATAGDTTVTIGTMVSGTFAAGDPVTIGMGSTIEVAKVASVAGTTVTFTAALRFAHPIGDMIFAHGFGASFSTNTYAVREQNSHFEKVAIGTILNGVRGFSADDCYSSASEFVRCTASERSVRIGPLATSGKPSVRHVIACVWGNGGGTTAPPAEILLTGPIQLVSGASAFTEVDVQGQSVFGVNQQVTRTTAGDGSSIMYHYSNVVSSNATARRERYQMGGQDVYELRAGGHLTANGLGLYGKAVTGSFTISDSTDPGLFRVTTLAAAITITLPTASAYTNQLIYVIDETGSASTKTITVQRAGASTINGGTTATITTNFGVLKLYSNGTNWFVL